MGIVNLQLLKHPTNWATVTLMVLIAAIAAHYFVTFAFPGAQPKKQ